MSIFNTAQEKVILWIKDFILLLFGYIEPIIYWSCAYIMIICVIVYYCSQDNRAIYNGIKAFLIYFTFCVIRSVIIWIL